MYPFDTTKQLLAKRQAELIDGGFVIMDVRRIQGNRYEIFARCVGR
ncbi:MAG: hypothetical protein ACRD3G_11475 [Vicinamibacterales bacterium]